MFCNAYADADAEISKCSSDTGVSWEYCEIFKNSFFYRTHPVPASASRINYLISNVIAIVEFKLLQEDKNMLNSSHFTKSL